MARLQEVHVTPESLTRFTPVIGEDAVREAEQLAAYTRERFAGHAIWNVNSTAAGGGVAEMLPSLLGYSRGLGIDARWLVIEGSAEFFEITKRLHHALHGSSGDGSPLEAAEHAVYQRVLRENAHELLRLVRPGDVVILHDPQTAGLAPELQAAGACVIWRCHVGQDETNAEVERGWAFLLPYLAGVPALIFSRREYVPRLLRDAHTVLIPPSIDPFTAKNEHLDNEIVAAVLARAGLAGDLDHAPPVSYTDARGAERTVERAADVVREGGPPPLTTPLVVQVSRWDPLKDPAGVMEGFAALVNGDAPAGAHLVLAGPEVTGVADDPEAAQVLEATIARWRLLPENARRRIHLAALPTADLAENATIVNALQRHARVIVQKSLHEGFGLTVTEAMWKGRPVVASLVGGIQDQIVDREHGLLLDDPRDLEAFSGLLREALEDRALAARLGVAGRERVRERFLVVRHLTQYAELLDRLHARID